MANCFDEMAATALLKKELDVQLNRINNIVKLIMLLLNILHPIIHPTQHKSVFC